MITAASLNDVRRLLKSAPSPTLVLAHDSTFNRAVLEQCKPSVLVMNHAQQKKDTLRSLDLPLNLVLARIAAKNPTALGIDLASLRTLVPPLKARELARISDCIAICRKTGTRLAILNAYTPEGASAFLRTLGASSQQASQALSF